MRAALFSFYETTTARKRALVRATAEERARFMSNNKERRSESCSLFSELLDAYIALRYARNSVHGLEMGFLSGKSSEDKQSDGVNVANSFVGTF